MANKKISELVSADALSGAELIETVQGGVNKKTTAQDIANLAPGAGHVIEDEGTPLTARTKLNFVGAGVTVTDDGGDDATVVTIPGGGGVASVTGDGVDNTDPDNPILSFPSVGDIGAAAAVHTHAISDVTNLQTSLDAKNDKAVAFDTQSGTTYTIQASDYGKRIHFTSDSNVTVTLPDGLPQGFWCEIEKKGDGNVSCAPDTGNGASLEAYGTTITEQYGIALLVNEGSDVWALHGRII